MFEDEDSGVSHTTPFLIILMLVVLVFMMVTSK